MSKRKIHPFSRRREEANQANAARSTGPRTEAGKSKASRNALRHGITARTIVLESENKADFDRLLNSYIARFQPVDDVEAELIHDLVVIRWHIGRIRGIESHIHQIEALHPDITGPIGYGNAPVRIALAFQHLADNSNTLALAARNLASLTRQFDRGLKRLTELRAAFSAPSNTKMQMEPNPIYGHCLRSLNLNGNSPLLPRINDNPPAPENAA